MAVFSFALLGGCGGDDPPDVHATMTAACAEARGIFAAAPEPVDPASETAFFEASHEATRAAYFPAEDLAEEVDDRALGELHFQLGRFPRLIGFHEPLGVAFEARAAVTRLDRFARELGVPECGAATWRPDAWASLTNRAADRPTEERFVADLAALCAETFGDLPDGGPQAGGEVVAGVFAQKALSTFKQELLGMPPPRSMEDQYIALIAALIDVDAVIPDVAPRNLPPDFQERVNAAAASFTNATERFGVGC